MVGSMTIGSCAAALFGLVMGGEGGLGLDHWRGTGGAGVAKVTPECRIICLVLQALPRLISAALLFAIAHCLDTGALTSAVSQIRFRFTINTTTTPTSTHINSRPK